MLIDILNGFIMNALVNELEKLRHHLKRGFVSELTVNEDGTTSHVDTINHCMLYAFGECTKEHQTHCIIPIKKECPENVRKMFRIIIYKFRTLSLSGKCSKTWWFPDVHFVRKLFGNCPGFVQVRNLS